MTPANDARRLALALQTRLVEPYLIFEVVKKCGVLAVGVKLASERHIAEDEVALLVSSAVGTY